MRCAPGFLRRFSRVAACLGMLATTLAAQGFPRVRIRATLSTQCLIGTVPLAFGVLTMSPTADLIWNTLVPASDGSVSAQVQHRNIIAGGGNVRVSLSTACGCRV